MDAFAASVTQGAQRARPQFKEALRPALYFGTAECVLPVLGWTLGMALGSIIAAVDHWIAFVLLLGIGTKMIYEAIWGERTPQFTTAPSAGRMLLLALGTSIDAAAVGVPLLVLNIPIITAAVIIGATTFAMTLAGYLIGGIAGQWVPRYAEGFGGFVLIGIGTAILLEHTVLQ